MNASEDWIAERLDDLTAKGLKRELRALSSVGGKFEHNGRTILNFSSNDYLDLARHPLLKEAAKTAIDHYGCGATASRSMAGTTTLHQQLESRLAAFEGKESALVFGSGFLANVGVIGALVGRGDSVFSDKLNHASIVDGILLSGAKLHRYRHCDCSHLDALLEDCQSGRKLVITDSVFSMDGDIAPISAIQDICRQHNAMLMLDEAHATGVFGPNCSGCAGANSDVFVTIGTLSKALGGYGGFAACSALTRDLLINRARGFIYTTGLPPASTASAIAALDLIQEHPQMGKGLLRRAETFRKNLQSLGFDTLGSSSQIVPIKIGDNEKAVSLSNALMKSGIIAAAIRPPTVPVGTARIRLSITLAHEEDDLERAAEVIHSTARKVGAL